MRVLYHDHWCLNSVCCHISGSIAGLRKEGYVLREIHRFVCYIIIIGVSISWVIKSTALLLTLRRKGMFRAKYVNMCIISLSLVSKLFVLSNPRHCSPRKRGVCFPRNREVDNHLWCLNHLCTQILGISADLEKEGNMTRKISECVCLSLLSVCLSS